MEDSTSPDILEERKKKVIGFLKSKQIWVVGVLIIALILGIYIRSIPMQVNPGTGNPGLWDITTNTWTLGPDLDPWLFLRTAEAIAENGSVPKIDTMRNVPLGFDNSIETQVLPYMIYGVYWLFNTFSLGVENPNIEFAGVIFPVIIFAFTILSFFLFVREIFVGKSNGSKIKANIISLISTFFMIVIPVFLSRTIAGIPEKESAAFFFMFLSFYLFLKAWKSNKEIISYVLGILAGISTAAMGLIWGGVIYAFIPIALATLFAFILNKIHKKEFIIYSLWTLSSLLLMPLFSQRFSFVGMLTSLSSGSAFLVFFIISVHFILWNTKISNLGIIKKSKLPKNIISIIFSFVLSLIISIVFIDYDFIIHKLQAIHQTIFQPTIGRWNTTVAENKQPFFTEWGSSFGPFIKGIPVLFWMFFIGSVVLFRNTLKWIKKKDAWILTGLYVLFLCGLIFSRYSPSSLFDGSNFISKFFYYITTLIFVASIVYYYLKYYKEGNTGFEKIHYEYLLLLSLFVLCLFTARGAVRLIMVLGPIAPIFVGYLIVSSISKFRKTKEEILKFFLGAIIVLILIGSLFSFWTFYGQVKTQASYSVPNYYNQQWQKAMQWVRNETPEDAVFSHWWDYGYWVQSIGKRPTMLDGGNAIAYWNYLTGRHVLVGDNEKDALDVLYNHNVSYFLIDSSDIGKYGAFSSIGSDENYDRYSWIPVMVSNSQQIQETQNGTIRFYQGGTVLDEDVVYDSDGKEIFLPAGKAGLGAIVLKIVNSGNSITFEQPKGIFVYNNVQTEIPFRYLYYNERFIDFGTGIDATAYIIQKVDQSGQGLVVDEMGATMYLSSRVMRGMLAQKYVLNDPFDNFPNFEIAHVEQNLIIDNLNSQGMNLREFAYYQGLQGPIKIWEIKYTGEEEIKEEYLDKDASKYLSWKL